MRSIRRYLHIAFLVTCAFMATQSFAETVQTKERTFAVKYKDGTIERYKVTWFANLEVEVHEDGHPAVPLSGQFTDTRQCHWSTSSHIERQVAMINKVGQSFAQSALSKSYASDFTNQGSAFVVLNFRSENCNDASARRNSDISNARANLNNIFPGIVDADLSRLKAEVKSNADVVNIEFQ
jgi:hypothetical protein